MPKMLDIPAQNLVSYLDSPNGCWRENAQKQIIILGDKSVVPLLEKMVADQIKFSGLGRLHSLWALEGLNAINKKLLLTALKDSDPQMRRAAIWISERYIKQNDKQWITNLGRLENDENFDVKTQLLLSLGASKNEFAQKIVQDILNKNPDNQMLASVRKSITKNEDAKIYGMKLAGFTPPQRKLILDGGEIYKAMCSACHGGDGKGLPTNAAPALYRAKHINADKEIAIRILLHGLKGPIEGKAYPSEMASMQDNTDEWIASVISYIRYEFAGTSIRIPNGGRQTAVVIPEEVRALRVKYSDVNEAWTIGAFDDFFSKTTNN
jgi:cytochrome c5